MVSIFSAKTQSEVNHYLTTKHAVSVLETNIFFSCEKDFPGFTLCLQKHKESEHSKLSRNEGLTFLVNSEIVRGRHHVFSFASTDLTPSFLKDEVQHVF